MTWYRLRLYVLGDTVRARAAVDRVGALCDSRLGQSWDLEVVDVQASPELADEARIVATPTLDRLEPGPPLRVVGDLSSAALADALDLPAPAAPDTEAVSP